jgi:hypothetical protein
VTGVLLIALAVLGGLLAVAGVVVALTGAGLLLGILLVVAGAAVGAFALFSLQVRDIYQSLKQWKGLFDDGGPDRARVVALQPPKGFLFRRNATVTLEVTKAGEATRTVEQGVPVPIPQAFLWRVLGRVPTPFGRLIDRRELNVPVWRRRRRRRERKNYTEEPVTRK